MSIVTIVVALIAMVIAYKVLAGVIKLGVILLIAGAAFYFLSRGAF